MLVVLRPRRRQLPKFSSCCSVGVGGWDLWYDMILCFVLYVFNDHYYLVLFEGMNEGMMNQTGMLDGLIRIMA